MANKAQVQRAPSKLKKGDEVVVIAGRDKGKRGRILAMEPKNNAALVEKVNLVKRHTKPGAQGDGGIIEKESPIQLSNLMYYDASAGKGSRIRTKQLEDGRKVRVAVASGEVIDS